MPKHKIQQFRPLFINGDGEILVLLKTGRYVPLDKCQLDGLKAFGVKFVDAPKEADDVPIVVTGVPPDGEPSIVPVVDNVISETSTDDAPKTPRKRKPRGD